MTDLLKLSGKDLEKELDRIAEENPATYRFWTEKELELLKKLRQRGVPNKKIAQLLDRSYDSVSGQIKRL